MYTCHVLALEVITVMKGIVIRNIIYNIEPVSVL